MKKTSIGAMNAYGILIRWQVLLNIAGTHMITDILLAHYVERSSGTMLTCAGTPRQNTLNYVMSAEELLFQMMYWWTILERPTQEQQCILESR